MGDEDVRHHAALPFRCWVDFALAKQLREQEPPAAEYGDRASDAAQLSANIEIEHDRDEHVDRCAPKTSGLEPPLGNGRHGFFIEASGVQRTDDTDLRRASVAGDDDFQYNRALNAVCERLARVLRLDFLDQARCGYCPASPVNATPSSTA